MNFVKCIAKQKEMRTTDTQTHIQIQVYGTISGSIERQ